MDVLLLGLGSSGDILPLCGLGRALRARGHRACVAANPHFAPMVQRAGLDFEPLGREEDYLQLLESPDFMDRVRGFRKVMSYAASLIRPIYELCAANRHALIAAHPLAFGARAAEARLGVQVATLLLSPAILQSAHEPPVLPGVINAAFLPSWYKRSVWWAADRLVIDPAIGPALNGFRASLGLPPLARIFQDGWQSGHHFVALFPEWFAPRQPDWPTHLTLTGFPLHDDHGDDDRADAALDEFLDGGEPPVVFTPGTGNRHARDFFAAAVEATGKMGRRALLLTRFAEQLPAPLPPHARHLSWVALGRLRGSIAALVHHGGIGTSAAGLAAGAPQLLMPFSHDQPDNAARLQRLGVATSLSPRRFRAARVQEELERLLGSSAVQARTRELAARVLAADPLGDAADALTGAAAAPAGQERCA